MFALLGIVFIFVSACNGTSPVEQPTSQPLPSPDPEPSPLTTPGFVAPGYDQRKLLRQLSDRVILPAHRDFVVALEGLEAATLAFGQNPTMETLDKAQAAWLEASLARMRLLPFRLGPIDETLLHIRLDHRPVDTDRIDQEIIGGDHPITADYVASIGSTAAGLGTMEYLLFDPIGGDEAVLSRFREDETGPRRKALLIEIGRYLPSLGRELENIWSPDAANYAHAFVEQGSGQLQSSINMLVNQMVFDIEDLVIERLGEPAGLSGEHGPNPLEFEAIYSQSTAERLAATLRGSRAAFSSEDGEGLDDYLDFLEAEYQGQPLSQAINDRYVSAINMLETLEQPLESAVLDNDETVAQVMDDLQALLVLLKVDMANHLGIVLTYNDKDGD